MFRWTGELYSCYNMTSLHPMEHASEWRAIPAVQVSGRTLQGLLSDSPLVERDCHTGRVRLKHADECLFLQASLGDRCPQLRCHSSVRCVSTGNRICPMLQWGRVKCHQIWLAQTQPASLNPAPCQSCLQNILGTLQTLESVPTGSNIRNMEDITSAMHLQFSTVYTWTACCALTIYTIYHT